MFLKFVITDRLDVCVGLVGGGRGGEKGETERGGQTDSDSDLHSFTADGSLTKEREREGGREGGRERERD